MSTSRQRRTKARTDADILRASDPVTGPVKASKLLHRQGVSPIPPALLGPAKGKNGAGRPRTGNKAIDIHPKTGEIGSSHAHLDLPYKRFLEGMREDDLHTALAVHPDKKFHMALQMLTHPKLKAHLRMDDKNRGKPGEWSIAAVLKRAGVSLPELMDVYGRYKTSQAVRVAMDRSAVIMQHTADDAENRKILCVRCDGLGTLDMDAVKDETESKRRKAIIRTCPECKGSGEVTQSGDNEARKLIFEVAGIAGKKGPVVDARSVHYGNGVFSVESLVRGMEEGEEPIAALNPAPPAPPAPPDSELPIIEAESEEPEQ